jgi:hypothetical protein
MKIKNATNFFKTINKTIYYYGIKKNYSNYYT